jgi:hypothetical protein
MIEVLISDRKQPILIDADMWEVHESGALLLLKRPSSMFSNYRPRVRDFAPGAWASVGYVR